MEKIFKEILEKLEKERIKKDINNLKKEMIQLKNKNNSKSKNSEEIIRDELKKQQMEHYLS